MPLYMLKLLLARLLPDSGFVFKDFASHTFILGRKAEML